MRRWVLGAVAVLAFVAVAIGVALHRADAWITSHRTWITRQLGDAIGRRVAFGEVGIRVLPQLAVRVTDLEIGDDSAFSAEPFVVADGVDASVAILPALVGRLVLSRIVLERPVVTLVRSDRGYNVETLGGRGARTEGRSVRAGRDRPVRGGESTEPSAAEEPETLPLAVTSARVRDGRVRLVDRRARRERTLEIEDVDVTIRGLSPSTPARIEARATLAGAARTAARLSGTIGPFDLGALSQTPVDVVAEASGVDVARVRADVAEVGAALPAPLGVEGTIGTTLRVTGTAAAPAFETELDAGRALVTWAEWFRKPGGVPLGVRAAGAQVGDGARIDQLTLSIFDDVAVRVDGEASPDRVALHVVMDPAEVTEFTTLVPTLAKAWRLRGTTGLDVRMRGSVRDGRTPAITGTAIMRDLAVEGTSGLRVAGLTQTVTFDGSYAKLPATTFTVNGTPVVAAGRLGPFGTTHVGLTDLDVRIFEGTVRGKLDLDRGSGATPRVSVDLRFDDIDVSKAAAIRAPGTAGNVAGAASGSVRVAGRGTNPDALRPTLNGDADIVVRDGRLRGVNLADRVLEAVAKVPGVGLVLPTDVRRRHPTLFGDGDTRFDEMTAVLRFENGVVRLVRSVLSASDYTIEGSGTLGLDGRLDGNAVLRLAPELSGEIMSKTGIGRLARGATGRLAIPFSIQGSWPRVRVVPDVAGIAQAMPGAVVPKAVEEGVGRLLDGLFKR